MRISTLKKFIKHHDFLARNRLLTRLQTLVNYQPSSKSTRGEKFFLCQIINFYNSISKEYKAPNIPKGYEKQSKLSDIHLYMLFKIGLGIKELPNFYVDDCDKQQ